jgi:plastocyanin
MRLLRPLAAMTTCLLAASVLAACVAANPGWTYTPAPPVTSAPSVEASDGPSAAPSGDAGAIQISALGIAFEQAEVDVPADEAFQIEFANNDAGVPHDVTIRRGDANGEEVFKGDTFNGVETRTYDVPGLDAGEYTFVCSVHPNMVGTLTAQ